MSPSMPSRSTNAPKSTMFEIDPSTTRPGCRRSRIRLAVLPRSSSSTARRRQHHVVARAVELDDLALDRLAHVLVEVRHAADVDERGGQEAAHAEVDDEAALDDLDDRADHRLAGLGRGLDAAPGALEAGALLGEDQAAVLVLLGEDEGVDLLTELDLFVRVDGLADRKLVGGDDPLALVADVDEDLVVVDAHDAAGEDVALFEVDERRVVVGDDLPVDLEQEPVGALNHRGVGVVRRGLDWVGMNGQVSGLGGVGGTLADACPSVPPSGAPSVRRSTRDADVVICGASASPASPPRASCGHRRARDRGGSLRDRGAPDVRLRRPHAWLRTSGSTPRSARRSATLVSHAARDSAGRCR